MNHVSIQRVIFKHDESALINLIKCKLCLGVLIDPHDCNCCNQTFCLNCISDYMNKYKKCPNKFDNGEIDENAEINLDNLKPTNQNISTFLNTLKFTCQNNNCSEEISYSNIFTHIKNCNAGNKNFSLRKTLQKRDESMSSELYQRQMSIMSFSGGRQELFQFNPENLHHDKCLSTNEKIDKIFDSLQILQQNILFSKGILKDPNIASNSFLTPNKEFNHSETPKFSMSFNNRHSEIYNTAESHRFNNNYNFTLNLQQEKIISELDHLGEKISNIENQVENWNILNENYMKKLIEDQFTSLYEKMRDNFFTLQSNTSTTNSVNSSIHYSSEHNKFPKSEGSKKVLKVSESVKKIKIDKFKLNDVNKTNKVNSPMAMASNVSPRYSPRTVINTQSKTNTARKESNVIIPNNNTNMNINIQEQIEKELGKFSLKINESLNQRIEELENSLVEKQENLFTEMKNFITDVLYEDIKTHFTEVTLDSTNLFVEKFEEFNKMANTQLAVK
jgi:hypothetical protein